MSEETTIEDVYASQLKAMKSVFSHFTHKFTSFSIINFIMLPKDMTFIQT